MKTLKHSLTKKLLLYVLLICNLVLIYCRKPDRPADPNAYLRFTQSRIELPSMPAARSYVLVESNVAWSVSSSASWISLSKTSGRGNDTIYITVTLDDPAAPQRSADIIADGSQLRAKVTVEQIRYSPQMVSGKLIGGADQEYFPDMAATPDGGYVLAGVTNSNGTGYIRPSHGNFDGLVVKMNSNNDTAWTRVFGGDGYDELNAITVTSDGFIVAAGYTNSDNNGDIRKNNGLEDGWLIKMKPNGDTVWTRLLGGAGGELFYAIASGPDGSIFVGGTASSSNGDVGGTKGMSDFWIMKLDANGNIAWKHTMGGSQQEYIAGIAVVNDGVVVTGNTLSSNTGDVGLNHGGEYDIWTVKLDLSGNIKWKKVLGGSKYENSGRIIATTDGCVVLTATTTSNQNGDVGKSNGLADMWVVKLKANGDTAWTKLLGGTREDIAYSAVAAPNGGVVLVGSTRSRNSGDVGENDGNEDYLIIKLNANGQKLWSHTLGGFLMDEACAILLKPDGQYTIAGQTWNSDDGDLAGLHNNGNNDWWIVTMKER